MSVVSMRRILTLFVTVSLCSTPVLSFLRPQTCSFSPLSHAPTAKASVMKRQAATAIPGGGAPSGKSERKAEQKKTARQISAETAQPPSQRQQSQPLSPGVNPSEVIPAGEGASPIETKTGGSTPPVGQGAKASLNSQAASRPPGKEGPSGLPSKQVEAPKTAAGATAAAVRGADSSTAAKAVGPAVVAVEKEETTATAGDKSTKKEKKNGGLSAAPETTAAEKVLTLLDIGLVDKEEVAAYYEALSELERTTQEAKAATATAAAAASLNPQSPSSSMQDGPLSLVPFPAVCAALGAAGTHSLHLTGGLGTAFSVCGAVAGVALGSLVVTGDDEVGRVARAAGSALTRSASTAGGAAGRSVSESVGGAVGGAASAAVSAVEEAIVKAPANFVAGLARSISDATSAAVGSVVALPGEIAAKAVDGAKGALQDTSEAVVNIPGEVARKAAQAAEGALQSTSETALNAVKESPKEAAKRLKEAVSAPGETLTAFVRGASGEGAGKREKRDKVQPAAASVSPGLDRRESTVAAPIKPDEQEPEGIPVEELEAKMLSVRKALERFDAVKNRIEEAHTSDTLLETVGMTRSMDVSAEREKSEEARAAAKKAKDTQVENKKVAGSRPSSLLASKPRVAPSERKTIDENRRKDVAERLLEKASQRATEAKAGLKAAAASVRREAEMAEVAPLTAGAGAEQKAPQDTVASR